MKTNTTTSKPDLILLLSGGLDSTVALYHQLAQGHRPNCLGFNYGQRHLAELRLARATCKKLGVPYDEIELARIKDLFLRCALTDGQSRNVVVPNRNGVFLNVACAIAESRGIGVVNYGATAEDYQRFKDCRGEWITSLNHCLQMAGLGVRVVAPYLHLTKREIVQIGRGLGVPFEETMSCYNGTNCGQCLACQTRKKALCGK